MIDRTVGRMVVAETIQRILAGVESRLAKIGRRLLVNLALLILKSATRHVRIESFISFHLYIF